MLVDGHRATSVRVRDGSVVKIGHTEIVVRVVDETVAPDEVDPDTGEEPGV